MKTINYFGIELKVPDKAKYIAMDGKMNNYELYWYNEKPEWDTDFNSWRINLSISTRASFKYDKIESKGRLTKPKHSLIELKD